MWTRWTAVAGTAAIAAGLVLSCATAQKPVVAPAADPIARGKYLSVLGGCNDCHTPGGMYGGPDMERTLSGSELGWTGPWGTTYPSNLTPDTETGIGAWTEADIVKALKIGQRPDGSPLLPPMPWPNTAQLTDEDLAALAAYLKSIPAVKHAVPARVAPGVVAKGFHHHAAAARVGRSEGAPRRFRRRPGCGQLERVPAQDRGSQPVRAGNENARS